MSIDRSAPGTQHEAAITEALGLAILATIDEPRGAPDGDRHLTIIRRTALAERAVRDLLRQSVIAARAGGHSWAAIGVELDMSRQAVQQRFGDRVADVATGPEERWLGPVTAFDEIRELEIAGRLGWHTVEAGLLRHRMVRTETQWEHKRIVWSRSVSKYGRDGWLIGCRAFPWMYLVRDTGRPAPGA